MTDNHQLGSPKTLWAALGAVVVVSVVLVISWFVTIEYLRRELESEISVLTQKTELLTKMRDYARNRAISVHRMVLLKDRFARDDEYLRLMNFGDLFLRARDEFLAMPLTAREQTLWDGMVPLFGKGKETQDRAIEAMQSGDNARAEQIVLHDIIPVQDNAMTALNILFESERDAAKMLVEHARGKYDHFAWLVLVLGGALLGATILAALMFTRRDHRSRKELLRAIEAARRADALRCEFLARVSHELRTPLTAIIGYTEILIEDYRNDRQLMRDVERIRVSGQHLLSLIDDVLDLSRIETGRYHMSRVAIDITTYIKELAEELRPTIQGQGNKLLVDCQTGLSLTTDPRALRTILVNLLSNASKFTARGSVLISASRLPDGALEFCIKDTGIGMDAEQLRRVFEPFVQASSEIGPRYGGTGLGLSVVRQLTRVVGARILIESNPGIGTKVSVVFDPNEAIRRSASERNLAGTVRIVDNAGM